MNNEPVAWMFEKDGAYMCIKHDSRVNYDGGIPLYTHPAKTLTDEEIEEVAQALIDDCSYCSLHFARAILRKAQEKCTK
jgi:hypothetical protein